MIVNLASALKLWPVIRKCLSHGRPSVLQTSFLCVFILKFKLYLDFPTYCNFSQRQHFINVITQLLLQVTLCMSKKLFLLEALWKVEQVLSCLQHRLTDLVKHGWHFPVFNSLRSKFFCYRKPCYHPIMPLRFLFLLNTKFGGSARISFHFGSICKICQFFSIIVLSSGRVLLWVTVSGKRSVLDVLFLFNNSFLGSVKARLICFVVSGLLQPFLVNVLSNLLHLLWKSFLL